MCPPTQLIFNFSTNSNVPAPHWTAVSHVKIPLSTCNDAADALIEWFGPEELKHVVGGERWWQVRSLSGVDAEWIAEQADIASSTEVKTKGKNPTAEEANIFRMEKLDTVMVFFLNMFCVSFILILHGSCTFTEVKLSRFPCVVALHNFIQGGYFCGSISKVSSMSFLIFVNVQIDTHRYQILHHGSFDLQTQFEMP
jgi:hypothetical protein